MDIGNIRNIPPFTRFYIVMIIITTFLVNCVPVLPTYWLFAFSIKQIVYSYQYWRILTNFLLAGQFSIGFVFFILTIYVRLSRLESDCIKNRRYSEFVMILFYNCLFMIGVSVFNKYALGYTESRSLLEPLTYALMSIYSYREPREKTSIFFFPIRNSYAPLALAFFAITSGGSFMSIAVGFIAGYLYVFLKEILPKKGIDILKTPWIIKKLCKDSIIPKKVEEKREPKEKQPFLHINPNDNTNTAYRERGTVADGREFQPFNENEIQW